MKSGAILLVAFNRPAELTLVLDSVKNSNLDPIKRLVVVQQPGNIEVSDICSRIDWADTELCLNQPIGNSVASKINNNIYTGLNLSFSDVNVDWVAVLEDDIVVAKDFFKFIDYIMKRYSDSKNFRGVNGFSGVLGNEENSADQYGEYRYGFGWGWAINRRNWELLQRIWNGKEESHWDVQVENFVKTGFVVMPVRSRILNVGFNGRATHTKRINSSVIAQEEKLRKSFVDVYYSGSYLKVQKDLNWRKDCRPYLQPSNLFAILVSITYKIAFFFRPLASGAKPSEMFRRFVRIGSEYTIGKLYLVNSFFLSKRHGVETTKAHLRKIR